MTVTPDPGDPNAGTPDPGPSPGIGAQERHVEQPPTDRSTILLWVLLLAGPVLWFSHFMVVYLVAEAVCAAAENGEPWFPGEGVLTAVIVVTTVVFAVACAAAGLAAWRRARGDDTDLAVFSWAGALLAAGSLIAVLAVGLPALALGPC